MAKTHPATDTAGASTAAVSRSPFLWWTLAAVVLVLGYADLWRGGETLAPILLVIGYCVLVPVAILRR